MSKENIGSTHKVNGTFNLYKSEKFEYNKKFL